MWSLHLGQRNAEHHTTATGRSGSYTVQLNLIGLNGSCGIAEVGYTGAGRGGAESGTIPV